MGRGEYVIRRTGCMCTSYNKYIICWKNFADLNESDSGLYTCSASSGSSETSWSAALKVDRSAKTNQHRNLDPSTFPGPPGTPKIVNVTDSSVTLSWSSPSPQIGVAPVIAYMVEYFSADLQTGWVVAAHRITSDTITVRYIITVSYTHLTLLTIYSV